jgi:membrane protein DedA with SNARE-associated domain
VTDALLAFVADWGALAVFCILAVNCFGVPFPSSLLLLACGALVATGDMDLLPLVLLGIGGAVLGDQAGFAVGRLGGARVTNLSARWTTLASALARAEDLSRRWGASSVFLSRWLVSPLGPYVNLAAGMAGLPWLVFTVAGVAGETIWVGLYIGLGMVFSTSIQALADVLGTLSWLILAAGVTVLIGWRLVLAIRARRHAPG